MMSGRGASSTCIGSGFMSAVVVEVVDSFTGSAVGDVTGATGAVLVPVVGLAEVLL